MKEQKCTLICMYCMLRNRKLYFLYPLFLFNSCILAISLISNYFALPLKL